MTQRSSKAGEFTGRHMLFAIIAFFGVVVAANLTLAAFANRSWSGLVVKNSYVASQQFNDRLREAREQAALGWSSRIGYTNGAFRFDLLDENGAPVFPDGVTATFRRPSFEAEDKVVKLAPDGRSFAARQDLGDGAWIVEVEADAGLARPYREVRRIHVRAGELR